MKQSTFALKKIVVFIFSAFVLHIAHAQFKPQKEKFELQREVSWNKLLVGDELAPNGHLVRPAGKSLALAKGDRVMNLQFVQNKKYLIVKADRHFYVIDAKNFKTIEQINYTEKGEYGSMNGLTVDADDSTVYISGTKQNVYVGSINKEGKFLFSKKINVSYDDKNSCPLGIGISNNRAYIALAISNKLAVVDLKNNKVVEMIETGVCPYEVVVSKDKELVFVSNFGGIQPLKNDKTELSSGTPVAVDERSVALRGSVSAFSTSTRKKVAEITTRIHPEAMKLSPDGTMLYVVDDSGDGISIINTKTLKVVETINTKPLADMPYGSLTNALAFSNDGKILYAANAGNNSIALINTQKPGAGPYAFIAAGGFPGSVAIAGEHLYIGNVTPLKGALQKVILPRNAAEQENYTREAKYGFHFIDILRAQAKANMKARPKAIPENAGEPSLIKHVVYIIKENKKYDQVLGGIGKGNSDPSLVEFAREVTPNTHKLAEDFVLLDNYYCNGINSSDGHQWAIQGITTPYHERDFTFAKCAYEFGVDPLAYAGCGFIWDHLLRKGISFRNFGETDLSELTKGQYWTDFYNAWKNKNDSAQFKCVYFIETLRKYSDMRFPGWHMNIPDQVRADAFINALAEYEQQGSLPEFIIIYLPNDHTSGYDENSPTPRAYVADNDLATGRIVEALSKSKFWKNMTIFINEDDPQTGADHVDGRRSFCLMAGPYVKRGALVSTFYNQSSVLHTICRIFGVSPMNQLVASAPVMKECFQDKPDYSSYSFLTPEVPINEMNLPISKMTSEVTKRLAPLTQKMDFSRPDLIDDDALMFSEYVWSTIHRDKPFPKAYFGPHGKGLKALGLTFDAVTDSD